MRTPRAPFLGDSHEFSHLIPRGKNSRIPQFPQFFFRIFDLFKFLSERLKSSTVQNKELNLFLSCKHKISWSFYFMIFKFLWCIYSLTDSHCNFRLFATVSAASKSTSLRACLVFLKFDTRSSKALSWSKIMATLFCSKVL